MFDAPSYTYTDLLEALEQPCCPVCWLAQRSVHQYIHSLFYEHVNDIKLREGIRASLGYCQEHTWALRDASLGNALGISIIYHDILTNILRGFPSAQTGGISGSNFFSRLSKEFSRRVQSLRNALTPQAACPACTMRDASAQMALGAFLRGLQTEQIAVPFRSAHGFCLIHLNQALPLVTDLGVFELLLEITRSQLGILDAELAEYIRKNDYRFNHEPWGSEEDAWRRVIARAAGERLA